MLQEFLNILSKLKKRVVVIVTLMIPKYCEIQGDNTDLGGICEKIFSSLTGKIGL